MTEHTPPEHSGTMENDPTGLHPAPASERGPLADVGGDLGTAARQFVAALNPHPAALESTERVVARIVTQIGDPEAVIALRYVVETAISRASAQPLMVPRGDQPGERVAGRAEPTIETVFCGFHSMHPAHLHTRTGGAYVRCLGMDASGPRGPLS